MRNAARLGATAILLLTAACASGRSEPQSAGSTPNAPGQPGSAPAANAGSTFEEEDVVAAAEEAFGAGAKGVAKLIEAIFADLGKPNAYIVGGEGGGALAVGLRYGEGTLFHKVEGQRRVYWTGPSLGIDIGGDASKTFTLVYNLYDTEELFDRRFPAVEGKVYAIAGFSTQYHQRDNIILVPIRLGVGWRFGANIGYLRYTKERRYNPF